MYQDLRGKTALVTGSGKKSGIGFAVAQKLAESGANIIIADLPKMDDRGRPPASNDLGELAVLAEELAGRFAVQTFFCCDGRNRWLIRPADGGTD
jgi:NAD(P)-dependent dehydrogenase (short-subunit alcohol dehydrogenase family)